MANDYDNFPAWLKRNKLSCYKFSKITGIPKSTAQYWANNEGSMPTIGMYGLIEIERRIRSAEGVARAQREKYAEFDGDDPDNPWEC